MVHIVDDTFIDRSRYKDYDFLKDSKYLNVCTIYTIVKTIELAPLVKQLSQCKLFCYHKTLQLYNTEGNALSIEDNSKSREALTNKAMQLSIPRVEFSRGVETNFEIYKIDKDLFYSNLKPLLDHYINTGQIESRILFWGESFREKERLLIVQKMMVKIRSSDPKDFENNKAIKQGLDVLYPHATNKQVIDEWIANQLTKNEIILRINNQI